MSPNPPAKNTRTGYVELRAFRAILALWTCLACSGCPDLEFDNLFGDDPTAATKAIQARLARAEMTWIYVPPGSFLQGANDREIANPVERPQHPVTLTRGFWLMATHVTQRIWSAHMPQLMPQCTQPDGTLMDPIWCEPECLDCPVHNVNWFDAIAFANALSAEEGLPTCYPTELCVGAPGEADHRCPDDLFSACEGSSDYHCDLERQNVIECFGYRLPTEAEWEYAARAGTTTTWPCGDSLVWAEPWEDPCVQDIDGNGSVHYPSATKDPNPWGFYDMFGNVDHWVSDYHPEGALEPYTAAALVDPYQACGGAVECEPHGPDRMGFGYMKRGVRGESSPRRSMGYPESHWQSIGFRLVRTATPAEMREKSRE